MSRVIDERHVLIDHANWSGPGLVEQQVRHGSQNKLMPAFEGAISDAQIRAVAAYVASTSFPGGSPGGSAGSAAAPR